MRLSIKIIGVGGGASKVYDNISSTSWVLLENDVPLVLFDLGLGVIHEYSKYFNKLPPQVYISHNHSDHSGELPVILAVESKKGEPITVISHDIVMKKLMYHRLDELKSTGHPVSYFMKAAILYDNHKINIGKDLYLEPIKAKHSEDCYGVLIYKEEDLILGWSADSGYEESYYNLLWKAPFVILDARLNGNNDHADFEEVKTYINRQKEPKKTLILGYGKKSEESNLYEVGYPGHQHELPL